MQSLPAGMSLTAEWTGLGSPHGESERTLGRRSAFLSDRRQIIWWVKLAELYTWSFGQT